MKNQTFLIDRLWKLQDDHGFISDEMIDQLSSELKISKIELEGVISFYHFFHRQNPGKYVIYLNNSIVSEFSGLNEVKQAFEEACHARFGTVDLTGTFGLYETSCIGLSDFEPAALINFKPVINLTPEKVQRIIAHLRLGKPIDEIADDIPLNVRYTPEPDKTIFFRDHEPGKSLSNLKKYHPETIIARVKHSQLVGMGGAFFPTGFKWESCRKEPATEKYIVCNADEGEPGTFKDRVLMQKHPELLIEGMIMAGYAVGAAKGLIYLRAEYFWMVDQIKEALERMREGGCLGKNACGIEGFHFDVTLHMGAGAYVCGEETALLESLEGKRGEPRPKIFFPTQRGFLNKPTVVNNVETFCAAARILELGGNFFGSLGREKSTGNKLLSVSGDIERPGVYEIEWGMTMAELLERCGAEDPYYVQMSGPSGYCINADSFQRTISQQDLSCGGSIMIFNSRRNIIDILRNFADFFKVESCGICTPCRAGNFLVRRKLDKLVYGLAEERDIKQLESWGDMMHMTSRCGLGKMATSTLKSAIREFPKFFGQQIHQSDGLNRQIDHDALITEYETFYTKNS